VIEQDRELRGDGAQPLRFRAAVAEAVLAPGEERRLAPGEERRFSRAGGLELLPQRRDLGARGVQRRWRVARAGRGVLQHPMDFNGRCGDS